MLVLSGIILILGAIVLMWIGIASTIGAVRWQHRPLVVYGLGIIAFSLALLSFTRAMFQQTNLLFPTIWFCALATTLFFIFRLLGGWGDLAARGLTLRRFLLVRRLPQA